MSPDSAPSPGEATTAEDLSLAGGEFRLFLTRLGIQGLLALGLIENPVSGEKRVTLGQAQMILADLLMLREKTRGNLAEEEAEALDKTISDLQHHYAKASAGPTE